VPEGDGFVVGSRRRLSRSLVLDAPASGFAATKALRANKNKPCRPMASAKEEVK
jgi:hypothetical protein